MIRSGRGGPPFLAAKKWGKEPRGASPLRTPLVSYVSPSPPFPGSGRLAAQGRQTPAGDRTTRNLRLRNCSCALGLRLYGRIQAKRKNYTPAENYSQPSVPLRENSAGRTASPLCDVRSQRGRCVSPWFAAGRGVRDLRAGLACRRARRASRLSLGLSLVSGHPDYS